MLFSFLCHSLNACYQLWTNYQEESNAKEYYVPHRLQPDDAASGAFTEESDFENN